LQGTELVPVAGYCEKPARFMVKRMFPNVIGGPGFARIVASQSKPRDTGGPLDRSCDAGKAQ
jgi:hypothetical protein